MTTELTQGQIRQSAFPANLMRQGAWALVRVTIGGMFVWVSFENLGKGAYTPAGYVGVINYYINARRHGNGFWDLWPAMRGCQSHARRDGDLARDLAGDWSAYRPAALVAFLFLGSLWVSKWGTARIWELLVPVLASLGLAGGRAGRAWGIDALLARRRPSSPWW